MLWFVAACTGPTPEPIPTPVVEDEVPTPTGVVREYEWEVSYGAWDLWLNAEQVVGRATGYTFDGEFWGPTIVCDLGDTVRVTLDNQTGDTIGITPGGMVYDADNDGLLRRAGPGESVTYTWEAMSGPGVFLWRSRQLDIKLRESQAMSGMIGLVVVRGRDWRETRPDRLLNAMMVRTYPPLTSVQPDLPGPWRHGPLDTACAQCIDTGVFPGDLHATHNQALVLQEIRPNPAGENAKNPWLTDSLEVPRIEIETGQTVRMHTTAYGTGVAAFHIEGLDWADPFTGQVVNTTWLAPGETRWADLGAIEAIGAHRIENFATTDYGLQSGWMVVSLPE
ncbi:MAG: multicopper oxidase domain-containing protein [Alphaproteobacteria bacterium]|nr:multicopper oxidase domain-containing protein [Alphaproteobacteria bacterium]